MVRRGRGGSHKTKQEMTKHLALLASLGSSGLSEHIGDLEWAEAKQVVTTRPPRPKKERPKGRGVELYLGYGPNNEGK